MIGFAGVFAQQRVSEAQERQDAEIAKFKSMRMAADMAIIEQSRNPEAHILSIEEEIACRNAKAVN